MTESEVRDCLNKVESGDLCRVILKEFNEIVRLSDGTFKELEHKGKKYPMLYKLKYRKRVEVSDENGTTSTTEETYALLTTEMTKEAVLSHSEQNECFRIYHCSTRDLFVNGEQNFSYDEYINMNYPLIKLRDENVVILKSVFVPISAIVYIEILKKDSINFDERRIPKEEVINCCEKHYKQNYITHLDKILKIKGLADTFLKLFDIRIITSIFISSSIS